MGERGIAQGILGLVRSGRGDYLIRLRKHDPSLGHHMAPKTTERPRDADRYIASDALVQHRGEQANGRISTYIIRSLPNLAKLSVGNGR